MRSRILRRFAATAIALGVIALGAVSCSDSPMQSRGHVAELASPMAQLAAIGQTFQDTPPAIIAEDMAIEPLAKPRGRGRVEILSTVETELITRSWLIKTVWIPEGVGAVGDDAIVFGTKKVGYSTLSLPDDALDEDQTIVIVQKLKGNRDIYLYPHGLEFEEDVTLSLSYKALKLKNDTEAEDLTLFYLNPESRGWDTLDSDVDTDAELVITDLEHFSRYGIGSDR